MHIWKYGKFHRTCKVCGKRQDWYVMAWNLYRAFSDGGWWEDVYPLPETKCTFKTYLKYRFRRLVKSA